MSTASVPTGKRSKKPILFVVLGLLLLVAAAAVSIHFYIASLERDGTRISFNPAGAVSMSSKPLDVVPSADLAQQGVACKCLATSANSEAMLFLRKERHAAKVEITAATADLDLAGLRYTLFDANDQEVGSGAVRLSGKLAAGQSREVEIPDFDLSRARRVAIGR